MWITATENWKVSYPGACAGILALAGVENPSFHPELEQGKLALQESLKARFETENDVSNLPAVQAYTEYYRRFKKTYHVMMQIQSVAFKGRAIPTAAGLVEAMFMAELEDALLTAGHDLDQLTLPIVVDTAGAAENYTLLRGAAQEPKPGDMLMRDGSGIISTIVYGPDQRTQITPQTQKVLFAVYAPAPIGEDAVRAHLENIRRYVQLVSPDAKTLALDIV